MYSEIQLKFHRTATGTFLPNTDTQFEMHSGQPGGGGSPKTSCLTHRAIYHFAGDLVREWGVPFHSPLLPCDSDSDPDPGVCVWQSFNHPLEHYPPALNYRRQIYGLINVNNLVLSRFTVPKLQSNRKVLDSRDPIQVFVLFSGERDSHPPFYLSCGMIRLIAAITSS